MDNLKSKVALYRYFCLLGKRTHHFVVFILFLLSCLHYSSFQVSNFLSAKVAPSLSEASCLQDQVLSFCCYSRVVSYIFSHQLIDRDSTLIIYRYIHRYLIYYIYINKQTYTHISFRHNNNTKLP